MYFLLIAFIFITQTAMADVITCVFTEPFVTTVYSTPKSKLTYQSMDKGTVVLNHVSLQFKENKVDLVTSEGKVIQELKLNHKGSDGMSDKVYPYEVKDYHDLTHKGVGGCSSNFLKASGK